MNTELVLSQLETQCLCAALPARNFSPLSPLFDHPARTTQPAALASGLSSLEKQYLWDATHRNLSLLGHKRLSPILSPSLRLMIFHGASSSTPTHEFYGNNKDIVQFQETYEQVIISAPRKEQDITHQLRLLFSEKKTLSHRYQLDLFEHEFILLLLLYSMSQDGVAMQASSAFSYLCEKLQTADLDLPVLGKRVRRGKLPSALSNQEQMDMALQLLVQNGLLVSVSTSPSFTVQPTPTVERLLVDLYHSPERYLLREESVRDQFLSRELSIFLAKDAHLLARCYHNEQFNSPVVHLEQIEWVQLTQLIHEMSHPKDYIPKLNLEVNTRLRAQVRC